MVAKAVVFVKDRLLYFFIRQGLNLFFNCLRNSVQSNLVIITQARKEGGN